MDAAKVVFRDLVAGGTQLGKEGIVQMLSILYDAFQLEQFVRFTVYYVTDNQEWVSGKRKVETIKEWWDALENAEVMSWDFFEKHVCTGETLADNRSQISSLMHFREGEDGTYTLAKLDSGSGAHQRKSRSSLNFGRSSTLPKKIQTDDRTMIPTAEFIQTFTPYCEKVWELFLAFKEPTEDTVRPYVAYVPVAVVWINNIISVKAISILNVEDGFRDGLALIRLIEVLSGVDLKGFVPQPVNLVEEYKNITLALKFAVHFKLDTHPVTPEDVHYGRFEKLIVLLVRIAEKWASVSIEDRRGKVASSPMSQSNSVELKVDQKEQDEIYRLSSLAQQTRRPFGQRYVVATEKKLEKRFTLATLPTNVFLVDMGPLGKEEVPYQQAKPLKEVLQELCKKHNIKDMDSYVASTLEGSELFWDSLLGEIPKMIQFLPVPTENKGASLSDLINASDVKAQRRLNQVTIAARNYEEEDEDERESRKRQLQRANAFEKVIDESVSNIALEGMRKEYEKLMETLQLDKIKEQTAKKKKSKSKPASKIQDVDLSELNKMVTSLDGFQKAYGTSEAARDFFDGLL